MKAFTVRQLVSASGGRYGGPVELLDTEISGIFTDSRKVTQGSVFAAIVGERVDGHSFIPLCIESGAVCSVCERRPTDGSPHILVDSTPEALIAIAAAYRSEFDIPFVGISGSVGKTSVKELICSVLSQGFNTCKTQGNFNNSLGVPLTLFSLDSSHEAAVIEMGISDFHEMEVLAGMVRPDVCVLTNIGNCHLEKLIDRDGVLRAKSEMFGFMREGGTAVLCGDDDKLRAIAEVNGKAPVFFGLGGNNDYYADNIRQNGTESLSFTAHCPDGCFEAEVHALGDHMAANAMAAVAVGRLYGLSYEQISTGIGDYKTVGSRSNVIKTEKLTVIDDCYNANPASVKAAIDTLCRFEGRHVAVLGDMKELGSAEHELHASVGEYAVNKGLDLVISIGELALDIYKETRKSIDSEWFLTIEEASLYMNEMLTIGDNVLVKASHSMHFEQLVSLICEL